MNDLVIIPSKDGSAYNEVDNTVELSRKPSGTLFRKHILTKGELIHPVTKSRIKIDDKFVSTLKDNFDKKVCPIVQVPLANAANQHVENPDANVGEVVDVEIKDDKVYAIIDARDEDAVKRFKNKTYIGASAMLSLDYEDTSTGKKAGPTLCHVAVTNRPYITNLDDYEEIVKASADISDDAVLLTEPAETEDTEKETGSENEPESKEQETMTKEELIAALKNDHGIDVEALQTEAAKPATDAAELSNKLVEALKNANVIKLSNSDDDTNVEQVVGAVVELANDNVKLTNRVDALELSNKEILATAEVEGKVRDGYIDPAKKDAMVKLYLSNQDLYTELLPAEPVIELSAQRGTSTDADDNKVELDVEAEAKRYLELGV
jgi:hypothetical protein